MNENVSTGSQNENESQNEVAQLVYVAVLGICLWVAISGGFL